MKKVQPIFQNPFEAFNPLKNLDRYLFLTRPAASQAEARRPRNERLADEALRKVGLSLAEAKCAALSARAIRRPAAARRHRPRADLATPN